MPGPSLVLRNVTLPSGRVADISLGEGKVIHTGSTAGSPDTIDCTGMFVLPAAIDVHVHMRGGTQSEKEDWTTGSKSAIAGGVTVVVDQPNTVPPISSPETFEKRVSDAQKHSFCNFAINSGVTPDTPFEAMWQAGAIAFGETFFAPSSYGDAIGGDDLSLALKQIHALGGLATVHAEEIAAGTDTDLVSHDSARSTGGETQAVRTVQQLNTSGCRLHFCHLSSADSVDAANGSFEVTPHHLFLSRERFGNHDTTGKVNPPLRSEKERKRLWKRWNRINIVASDHAPHTKEEKMQEFSRAPSGIPGVETMVPLLMAQVIAKKITVPSVIQKTSTAPADLLGIPRPGFETGDRADFAVYPKKTVLISGNQLHSKCGWTPFEGFPGVFPEIVIMDGHVVFNRGEFFRSRPTWYHGKGFRLQ
jgi:dihydroorotase